MSDTVLFGKTVSGTDKAMLLYAAATFCLAFGGSCLAMKKVDWDEMFIIQKIGWILSNTGAVLTTIKAFYSNSSPQPASKG